MHADQISATRVATSARTESPDPGIASAGPDTNAVLDVVVAERTDLAEDVVGLTLHRADGGPLPRWDAGSHIDLIFPTPTLGTLTRQYSLCGDPSDNREWRVAVLGDRHGRGGSRHLCDRLQAGAVLQVRGPRNHFPFAAAEEYLFLAGGIGITPIRPMVAAAAATGARWRLHYAGRKRSRMAFAADFAATYPDKVHVIAEDEHGFPDLRSILCGASRNTAVYSCGPAPMLEAVVATCQELGLPAPHLERFTAVQPEPGTFQDTPVDVEFRRLGVTRTVSENESILDVAEELGSPIFGSCREGICGTCETRVLEGAPEHRDALLSDARRADHMLICVSRATSPWLVLDA
ncbi:PDR/VanB family oxidoreductase [Actinomadura rugatobispora]|uniref:PDR/VanB family oxidoreductase n=1 Tax=Actinomadura rugatobispora TaxID=1994 RepID=A0ABW1A4N2_9ACTN|nr:PDR/VanB family oxidoreductase [Actinomadura rugatobispora]